SARWPTRDLPSTRRLLRPHPRPILDIYKPQQPAIVRRHEGSRFAERMLNRRSVDYALLREPSVEQPLLQLEAVALVDFGDEAVRRAFGAPQRDLRGEIRCKCAARDSSVAAVLEPVPARHRKAGLHERLPEQGSDHRQSGLWIETL